MQDTKRHPIRFAIPILLGIALTGCALDPVNLVLQANSALYTPPPPDPFGGLTRESTGATPGDYRKLGCRELATELENQTKVLSLISASDNTGRTMQHWHIDAIETVQKEKQCSATSTPVVSSVQSTSKKPMQAAADASPPTAKSSAPKVEEISSEPYCFGMYQAVSGNTPRPLLSIPAPAPRTDVDHAAVYNRFRQFMAHVQHVQPGVWHRDMSVTECKAGHLCSAEALRNFFGVSHIAMLFCENSKELSNSGFEKLKRSLSSPQIIEWNP